MANTLKYKYTDKELRLAVKSSDSFTEVFTALGMRKSGSAHKIIKRRCDDLGIDYTHFYSKRHGKRISLDEYLVLDGRAISSSDLKKKLLDAGRIQLKCSRVECGIEDWFGSQSIFDLDHINGNRHDNRIENLRVLCANCHRLTETWGRRSNQERVPVIAAQSRPMKEPARYCECGIPLSTGAAKMCGSCWKASDKSTFKFKSVEDTIKDVESLGYTGAAALIGCSDNGLRKYLRRNGVDTADVKRVNNK